MFLLGTRSKKELDDELKPHNVMMYRNITNIIKGFNTINGYPEDHNLFVDGNCIVYAPNSRELCRIVYDGNYLFHAYYLDNVEDEIQDILDIMFKKKSKKNR